MRSNSNGSQQWLWLRVVHSRWPVLRRRPPPPPRPQRPPCPAHIEMCEIVSFSRDTCEKLRFIMLTFGRVCNQKRVATPCRQGSCSSDMYGFSRWPVLRRRPPRPPRLQRAPCPAQISYEKAVRLKLSGNRVCDTNSLILLVKNRLCSKPHYQKVSNRHPFPTRLNHGGLLFSGALLVLLDRRGPPLPAFNHM